MPTSPYSEVMGATDCVALFGTSEKRAKIRYRRLARMVHPDVEGGSEEAMARLNELWDQYVSRDASKGPKRPREVTRGTFLALFEEDGRWLVVDRMAGTRLGGADLSGLAKILDGSPVVPLIEGEPVSISQSDGTHRAIRCDIPAFVGDGRHVIALGSLRNSLEGGVLDAADLAWIARRAIFLSDAISRCGLGSDYVFDSVAIDPKTHTMVFLGARWLETHGTSRGLLRGALLEGFEEAIRPITGSDERSRRIMRFVRGTALDGVTEIWPLMYEYDKLVVELFGEIRFHHMKMVKDDL